MTTPAITELLNQHAALLASRELSFDEKVGYLLARLQLPELDHLSFTLPDLAFSTRRSTIRAAMIERQNEQLKALAHKQTETETARQTKRTAQPARDLIQEIANERIATSLAAERLQRASGENYIRALENLQLHTNRLVALERKRK